jgi:PPK2 family polyphosphate:nucleotide phosphotransferase
MKIDTKDFTVTPGSRVELDTWPTDIDPLYTSGEHYRKNLASDTKALSSLQRMLYASDSFALLLIFQAMDAAGKDGAIGHVLTGVNPQGCEVFSFKAPSVGELAHDFLWRTTCRLPERGRIGVFNRSYYEEVLIVRVHEKILAHEGLPGKAAGKRLWKDRFASIVNLEEHLHRNGTRVLKFFLHLSKEEQRKRFLERLDDPEKNWKISDADFAERKYWDHYMRSYEDCMAATSTQAAPWHVVPADDKLNARLIVSHIVIKTLQGLDLSYPETTHARRRELKALRKQLAE